MTPGPPPRDPGQAACDAFYGYFGTDGSSAVPEIDEQHRPAWAAAAQAANDAATEGALRACGYTLADIARFLEAEAVRPADDVKPAPEYPHPDGDVTVIGPECFASDDETVIAWKGENYYRTGAMPGDSPTWEQLADSLRRERDGLFAETEKLRRQLRDAALSEPVQPQPAPELAALRNSVTGLIGMWDGMRKVCTLSDGEWEDWRAALGRLVEELATHLDAIERPAPELAAGDGDCAECDTPRVVCPAHARPPEVSREPAAAMAETRRYREAMERVQRHLSDSALPHSNRVKLALSAATEGLVGK